MSRPLGPLQQKLLAALRRHGRDTTLESLAALSAGLIPDLNARPPFGRDPSRPKYVSVARAVSTLHRRGLVDVEVAGVARGCLEWPKNANAGARPAWRFRHPGKRLRVRAVVDSLLSKM